MCEHADLCSLSLSLAQLSVVAISLLPSAPRFLEHWPHSPKLSLCALPVCSIPGRVTQCFFCTSRYLSMHSCLSCSPREAPCQASLPAETCWVILNPCHLSCRFQTGDKSLSSTLPRPPSLPAPQCSFVLITMDSPRCFWCENYEDREGREHCTAFSLLPSGL